MRLVGVQQVLHPLLVHLELQRVAVLRAGRKARRCQRHDATWWRGGQQPPPSPSRCTRRPAAACHSQPRAGAPQPPPAHLPIGPTCSSSRSRSFVSSSERASPSSCLVMSQKACTLFCAAGRTAGWRWGSAFGRSARQAGARRTAPWGLPGLGAAACDRCSGPHPLQLHRIACQLLVAQAALQRVRLLLQLVCSRRRAGRHLRR